MLIASKLMKRGDKRKKIFEKHNPSGSSVTAASAGQAEIARVLSSRRRIEVSNSQKVTSMCLGQNDQSKSHNKLIDREFHSTLIPTFIPGNHSGAHSNAPSTVTPDQIGRLPMQAAPSLKNNLNELAANAFRPGECSLPDEW